MQALLPKLAALARISLMTAMQYRSDFVFDILGAGIRAASAVLPLALVYSHVDTIAGWSAAEATLVMALFLLLSGFNEGLMEPNLGEVVEDVRLGRFDLVLMKPLDAQVLVTLRRVDLSGLWNVLAAALLGGWALSRAGLPGPLDAAVAALMLACGLVAMYGLWLLAICASFYFVRVDNLRFLIWTAADAGRWPVQVFGGWVRWALITVVPVGMLTTFPAMALTGRWTAQTVVTGLVVAASFAALSRFAWRRALARYSSASS